MYKLIAHISKTLSITFFFSSCHHGDRQGMMKSGGHTERHAQPNEQCIIHPTYQNACTLMKARLWDYLDMVLSSHEIDLAACDEQGRTLLMQAAQLKAMRPLKVLINRKLDLNTQDRQGNTALIYAAKSCHTKAIKALIKAGASLAIKNNDGHTALMDAITPDNKIPYKALKLIINSTPSMNLNRENAKGYTPLMYAISLDHGEAVYLLSRIPDVRNYAPSGYTALDWAGWQNKDNMKRILAIWKDPTPLQDDPRKTLDH